MSSTPPQIRRSATGFRLRDPSRNLMRNFTLENVIAAIEAGRDIDERDPEDRMTLLMEAVSRGKEDIVEYLINQGADLDITNSDGQTALLCYMNSIYKIDRPEKIVQMLLEADTLLLPDPFRKMPYDIANNFYNSLKSKLTNNLGSENENNRMIFKARKNAEREEEKSRIAAWRASVGLAPIDPNDIEWNESSLTTIKARNIRDLIKRYSDQYVKKIKIGTMSSRRVSTLYIDVRMTVDILKGIIAYFSDYDFNFNLLVPSFHNKVMEDERAVSDYGLRDESRIIVSPKIATGYKLGGRRNATRRNKRNNKKTRRHN